MEQNQLVPVWRMKDIMNTLRNSIKSDINMETIKEQFRKQRNIPSEESFDMEFKDVKFVLHEDRGAIEISFDVGLSFTVKMGLDGKQVSDVVTPEDKIEQLGSESSEELLDFHYRE